MLFGREYLGEAIVFWREERGLNQARLAEALGVGRPTMSNYESGKKPLTEATLTKIALVLKIEVIDLHDAAYSIFRFNYFRVKAQKEGVELEELLGLHDPRASVAEVLTAHTAYTEKRLEFDRLLIELIGRERSNGFTVLRRIVEARKKRAPRKKAS